MLSHVKFSKADDGIKFNMYQYSSHQTKTLGESFPLIG